MISFYTEFLANQVVSINISQAQVVASDSFSICAYLSSVSDIERDAKATGFQE